MFDLSPKTIYHPTNNRILVIRKKTGKIKEFIPVKVTISQRWDDDKTQTNTDFAEYFTHGKTIKLKLTLIQKRICQMFIYGISECTNEFLSGWWDQ